MTSNLKALGGCSGHHLQGADAYYGGLTTARTACYKLADSLDKVAEPKNSGLVRSTWLWEQGEGERGETAAAARHRSLIGFRANSGAESR